MCVLWKPEFEAPLWAIFQLLSSHSWNYCCTRSFHSEVFRLYDEFSHWGWLYWITHIITRCQTWSHADQKHKGPTRLHFMSLCQTAALMFEGAPVCVKYSEVIHRINCFKITAGCKWVFVRADECCFPLAGLMNQVFLKSVIHLGEHVFLVLTCCAVCVTGNCQRNKPCYRNLSRRSQRLTSVCRWRTRSSSGSFTTETWVALAERPQQPQPPPLMPSASNHLAALASSPALLCLPDNPSLLLPVSRSLLWSSSPPGVMSQVCFPFGSLRIEWTLALCIRGRENIKVAQKHLSAVALFFAFHLCWLGYRKGESQDFDGMNESFFVLHVDRGASADIPMYYMSLKYSYCIQMLGLHRFSVQPCKVRLAKSWGDCSSPVYFIWNVWNMGSPETVLWWHIEIILPSARRSVCCMFRIPFFYF